MPTYAFRCPECGAEFDEKRSFARADEPATCPACHASGATKMLTAVGYYTPGAAAKAMLEPKPATRAVPVAHGASCPCCAGRDV